MIVVFILHIYRLEVELFYIKSELFIREKNFEICDGALFCYIFINLLLLSEIKLSLDFHRKIV